MKITLIIIGIIVAILISLRIYLPFYIRDQINKNLNEIEGLSGNVDQVSLGLISGYVRLSGFSVYYEDFPDPSRPLVSFAQKEINVDLSTLFKRKLVAAINIDSLVVNYVIYEVAVEVEEIDIVRVLKELMDFQIDIIITNGRINFADITATPNIEFSMADFFMEANYLTNEVFMNDTLPASLQIKGTAMGSGSLEANLGINYMKEIPDFDFDIKLENIDLTDFNDFAKAYGGFEFHKGIINVYSEAAANDGYMEGYVKPVSEDVEVIPTEDDEGFFQKFYESVLDLVASILESPDEDEHIATRIEFEGRIDDPDVGVWQAVWNLLRNAFIEGFSKGLEHTIDFDDLTEND